MRTLGLGLLISALSAIAVACGGQMTPVENPPSSTDLLQPPAPSADLGPAPSPAFDWTGTWIIDTSYNVLCTAQPGTNQGQRASQSHSGTIMIDKNPNGGGVVADIDGYSLTGVGTSTRLVLNGSYPVRDWANNVVGAGSSNNINITVDTIVSKDEATGGVTGMFVNRQGLKCNIEGTGRVRMTR